MDKLEKKSLKNKDARIKYNKIDQYIEILRKYGIAAGGPFIKRLDGEIWELRPLRDRILSFVRHNDSFILIKLFYEKHAKDTEKRDRESKEHDGRFQSKEQWI